MNSNGKTRLCHVVTSPLDRFGVGKRVRQEAAISCEAGFAVDMIRGSNSNPDMMVKELLPNVEYFHIPQLTKYIYPHKDLLTVFTLYRLFKQRRYKVVHTHLAKAGVLGRLAAGLAKVPVIIHSVYGPSFPAVLSCQKRCLFLALEKFAGRYTTHYIFTANHMQETFESHGIGPMANKLIIKPGVDLTHFANVRSLAPQERVNLRRNFNFNPDDLIVGYVSRIVPSKGHAYAIRALKQLSQRYPRLKLCFVGGALWPEEHRQLAFLKDLVRELGIEEKVLFVGHQSNTIPYYQIFDVFIFPSLFEAIGMVVFEALLMGLPVVAFDIPAVREFFPQATLAPLGDYQGLAAALEHTLQANEPRNKVDKESVVFQFSPGRWRSELMQFYIKIIQSNNLSKVD
jgi:glycosyltransferase involved in cell wall biosynthesis